MKARLYANGRLLLEADIAETVMRESPGYGRQLGPSDIISVALFEDCPRPGARPLFLTGRLEQI